MKITLQEEYVGSFLIVSDDGPAKLIQSDYEFPALAQAFGLSLKSDMCDHKQTDGTIDCPDCGALASEFISLSFDYLYSIIGATIDDHGYFS